MLGKELLGIATMRALNNHHKRPAISKASWMLYLMLLKREVVVQWASFANFHTENGGGGLETFYMFNRFELIYFIWTKAMHFLLWLTIFYSI